jgi:hypothetical protein
MMDFPPIKEQAANLLGDMVRVIQTPGSRFVDSEVTKSRLDICYACEFLKGNRCMACGCFLEAKTHLVGVTCPKGKW